MSQVNVIFAVNETTWGFLKQNFQHDVDGNRLRTDLTDSQARKLRANVHGHWKTPDIGGTTYHVVSWYIPEIYIDDEVGETSGLKWLEFLLTEFPNKFHVIGAWNYDGSQFGTEIASAVMDYSNPENPVEVTPETVNGTPIYPIHTQYMKIFPDDVEYDGEGNEVSRTPASGPKEVNKVAGWADRRWE